MTNASSTSLHFLFFEQAAQPHTFFGSFLQIGEVVSIAGGNFEERHIQLMEELHSHLRKLK